VHKNPQKIGHLQTVANFTIFPNFYRHCDGTTLIEKFEKNRFFKNISAYSAAVLSKQ